MTNRLHQFVAIMLCSTVVLVGGCNNSKESGAPQTLTAPADAIHTEIERGPVRVSVDVEPKEPRLSDEPTLTLTVVSDEGVVIEMPPFGDSMEEFIIRDFYEPPPEASSGRRIQKQIYTLEPTTAGGISVAPMFVRFTDNRTNGDGKEHVVETESLRINVGTMIESEAPTLNNLRPVVAPMDVPSPVVTWQTGLVVFGALAAIAALAVFVIRRGRRQHKEPELTPQQLAWRELNDLISSKISDTDIKEYFVQLTGVVRRYIERSTGVSAPEQTTEEFLREVSQQSVFSGENDERLAAFLESADLVKFAGYEPDPEQVKQSTHKAKQFIELQTVSTDTEAGVGPIESGVPS